jgi:hypothetical protein
MHGNFNNEGLAKLADAVSALNSRYLALLDSPRSSRPARPRFNRNRTPWFTSDPVPKLPSSQEAHPSSSSPSTSMTTEFVSLSLPQSEQPDQLTV